MLYPETRAQLQDIIRKAANDGRGLVPVSSGAPHIHGASENAGAETVSFERMNKIMKIDRFARYVRVEAGVTFGELIPKVREAGMKMNIPFLPRMNKSVVASMLEREGVLTPKYQYDYTDPMLTTEVIYGNGELFHTGSAAGPGPVEELKADMVNPWGPGSIDFMRFLSGAQGTMGFVTWATIKTEVCPSMSKTVFVESDELEPLTDLCAELQFRRVVDDCIILDAVNFANAFCDTLDEADALCAGLHKWICVCKICGFDRYPEERIKIYSGYFDECCAKRGLTALSAPTGAEGMAEKVSDMLCDCDRRETYWKMRRGAVREIIFLAPPSKAAELVSVLREAVRLPNVGITVQPQVQGRAFRIECDVFCEDKNQVEDICFAAEKRLLEAGAFFDRPYGRIADPVYAKDEAATAALRKVKSIFDPKGILNPGKLCF